MFPLTAVLGTFERFNRLACYLRPVRVICINRRHYPGTTSFSPAELRIIMSATDQEKAKLLDQQGKDLAALVVALIKQCGLPQNGGVTLAGWSLGTSYMLAIVAAINHLDQDVRECLQKYVAGFLIWGERRSSMTSREQLIIGHTVFRSLF